MGEDTDGMVESTAKLQEKIKAMTGVDILEEDQETFKSTYQIIKEIAEVWDGLSDINQASLLEMIAGKRQSNIVAATLNNMADLEKSMSVTTNAEGSAMTEHDRWMQSIEASEARAQAAVEEFSNSFMSSALVKFTYDAKTGILGFLTTITDTIGGLPVALTGLSGIMSMMGKGLFQKNTLMGRYTLFGANTLARSDVDYSTLGQIGAAMGTSSATTALGAYNEALATLNLDAYDFNASTQVVIDNVLKQNTTVASATAAMNAYSVAMRNGTTIGAKLSTALAGVGAALKSMLVVAAASTVISLVAQGIEHIVNAEDYAQQALQDTSAEWQSAKTKVEELNTELEETKSLMTELGNKSALTPVEQEDLNLLKQKNDELERQLKIAESMERQAKKETYASAMDVYDQKSLGGTGRGNVRLDNGVLEAIAGVTGVVTGLELSIDYGRGGENSTAAYATMEDAAKIYKGAYVYANEQLNKAKEAKDEKQEEYYKGVVSDISDATLKLYTSVDEILSSAGVTEKITGDNLTKDELGINALFDLRETFGLINMATQGENIKKETLDIATSTYSDVFDGIVKYIEKNGTIMEDTFESVFGNTDFTNYLKKWGWTTEEIVSQLISDYAVEVKEAASTVTSQYGTFDTLTSSLYNTTNAYTALKTAMDEQAKSGYLSVNTYKELIAENANFADYLELTAGGWKLNTEAVNEYMQAQDATTRMNALAAIIDLDEQIADARENLVNSSDELDAAYDSIDALEDERTQLAMLVTSLDSASGAYQRYLAAKETADSSDMYDAATSMYDDYAEQRKKGRTGTDDFQTMTEYIMGEDWKSKTDGTQASRDAVYKEAEKKYKRYFGQDKELDGAVNFLKDVQKVDSSLVSGNDKDGYLITAGTSMEQLAEAAGVSVDAVDALIGLMEAHEIDFGREFDIPEETKKEVEEYTDILEKAEEKRTEASKKRAEAEQAEAEGNDSSNLTAEAEQLEAEADALENAANVMAGATEQPIETMSVEELQTKVVELSDAMDVLSTNGLTIPVSLTAQYEEAKAFLDQLTGAQSNPLTVDVSLPEEQSNPSKGKYEYVDWYSADGQSVTRGYVNGKEETETWELPVADQEVVSANNIWKDEQYGQGDFSGLVSDVEDANSEMEELASNTEDFSDAASSADKSMGDAADNESVMVDDSIVDDVIDATTEMLNAKEIALSGLGDGDGNTKNAIYEQSAALSAAATEFAAAYENLKNTDPGDTEAYAAASQGLQTAASNYSTAYSTLQTTLSGLQTVNVTANTSQAISKINALSNKVVTITVRANTSGISLPGHAKGTSNAQAGLSLVDEKGAELIEHTSKGTFELGTNKGARLTNLDKGDVVHTADETKSILKRIGLKIGGSFRNGLNAAKGVLTGGAFSGGSIARVVKGIIKVGTAVYQSTSVKSSSSSSSSSKKKKSGGGGGGSSKSTKWDDYLDQLFDWIEVKLKRLEEATDRWTSEAAEAVGYIFRNAKLESALSSVEDQIKANTSAYSAYIAQADEVAEKLAIEEDIINKIKDGSIEIASYDEDTQKKISAYKEWYDKAVECKDALYDLREQERELAEEKLDNILDHYQYRIDRLDAIVDYGDSLIDLKNDTGAAVVASDYNDAIDATTQKIAELLESKETLSKEFASLVERGLISEGSEAWNDYTGELEDLDQTIVETKSDLQKLNDAVSQITITNLEYAMDALDATSEKIQGMMALHEAQGLDNTDTDYQDLIKNGMEQIAILEQQNEEYKKQQQGLDVLSEKYQDLQSNIDKNNQSILDMKESQEEWNDSTIDLRIAQIQEYQEELNKANDKFDRQKQLEQAIEDLQKAKTQRTQRVYRGKSQGFVYEADQDAVKSAQDNLDSVIHNEVISKMDDIIDALEEYKDDTNVYDAMGNLLGEEYSLPNISDYSELLNLYSGSSIITDAMQAAKDAAYQQVMNSVANATNNVTIGDITVQGVDDANGLAEAIVDQLGNAVLQEMYSRT